MIDQASVLIAISMMAVIVYLTRLVGYFAGLQLRHIKGIRPVLEVLPGCAFMAILAPAVRDADPSELIAMACLILLMWRTNNVALSTVFAIVVLFVGQSML